MKVRLLGRLRLLLASAWLAHTEVHAQITAERLLKLTPREIERALPNEHPSTYYLYAARLWGEGHRDDAVFWLYAGQLRFRFHLLANPNLPRSGDPALIASLQATIGEPINLFVGGDLKNWRGQIARVLAWDEKTVNGFTSKTTHAKILAETRAGLEKLSDHIEKNADTIRAQREQEGIGTIGVVKGTYIEERKRKMPKEWPALSATTKLADLAGSYGAAADTALAAVFFAGSPAEIFRASAFRLTVVAPDLLEISASREADQLARSRVFVREEFGAIIFERVQAGAAAGLSQGESRTIVRLRTNTNGELVMQRDSVTEGKYPNKPTPIRLSYTSWNRAKRLPVPDASQPLSKP